MNIGGGTCRKTTKSLPLDSIQSTARDVSTILHQYQDQCHLPFDVMALSETHYQCPASDAAEPIPNFCKGMSAYHSYATLRDRSAGLVLLYAPWVPPPLDLLAPHIQANPGVYTANFEGRFMLHKIILQDHIIVLAFIYGYAKSNSWASGNLIKEAYDISISVLRMLQASTQHHVSLLFTGDLNAFPFNRNVQCYAGHAKASLQLRHRPSKTKHAKVRLSEIEDEGFLVHAWDLENGINAPYLTNTVPITKGRVTRTGIDHMYINRASMALVSNFTHHPLPVLNGKKITTHDILSITLKGVFQHALKYATPTAAFPHLRSYPFGNSVFLESVLQSITTVSTKAEITGDWLLAFDSLHSLVTKGCVVFAKKAERKMGYKVAALECRLASLKTKGALDSGSQLVSDYEETRSQLQHCNHLIHLESIHTVKHLTDLKASVAKDEDTPEISKHWIDSFRNHLDSAKIIPGIFLNPSSNVTDPVTLREMAFTFFSKKFAPPSKAKSRATRRKVIRNPTTPDFVKLLPKLSTDAIAALSLPFTAAEIMPVLAEFRGKFDTSPGIDALPAQFFASVVLRESLANLIANVINQIAQSGDLSENFKRTVIRLLHKDGKSRIHFDGYRPISLLPIITRIIARAITLRLHPYLAGLIHRQQTAYVPGRRMDHNMLLLQQFFLDAAAADSTAILLQIDFLQAFDSVYHSFVKRVLIHIGIPPLLLALIMALVSSMEACIIINDGLTRFFRIGRGLPQGSSLSAIIFVIILEPLLVYMREHPLTGLGVRLAPGLNADSHFSYGSYADDVNAPAINIDLITAWFKSAALFELVSGLGINMVKTQVHLIGSAYWSPTMGTLPAAVTAIATMKAAFPGLPSNCYRIGEDVKYCGIIFSLRDYRLLNQFGSLTSKSWLTRIAKLIPLLGFYASCPLRSWRDRTNFALTHLLSRIQFLALSCPCPPKLIITLQAALNGFVFNQPKTPISMRIASAPPAMTGFSYVNLTMRFKAFSASTYVQFLKGSLPPNLSALVSGALLGLLQHSLSGSTYFTIPMALHHPTAILDAALSVLSCYDTTTTTTKVRSLPDNILPILHTGLVTLSPLELNRTFQPPEGPLHPLIGEILLYENLHLNSAIIPRSPHHFALNQLPWPPFYQRLSLAALSLTRVADLYTFSGTAYAFNPIEALSASPFDSAVAARTLAIPSVHPRLQQLLDFNLPAATFDSWSKLMFPNLRPQVAIFISQPPPLPVQSVLQELILNASYHPLTYHNPSYVQSAAALHQQPLGDGSMHMITLASSSTKQLYQALTTITFNNMSNADKIAAPFAPGHGWAHYASLAAYPHDPQQVALAIESIRGALPSHLHHVLLRVLYLQVVKHLPSRHQPTGNHGHWPDCPRCGAPQLDPPHRLLQCPGLIAFWSFFRRVITSVLPALVPSLPLNIQAFTMTTLSSIGFYPPLKSADQLTSFVFFACAFDAILNDKVPMPPRLPTHGALHFSRLRTCFISSLMTWIRSQTPLGDVSRTLLNPHHPPCIWFMHGITVLSSACPASNSPSLSETSSTLLLQRGTFIARFYPLVSTVDFNNNRPLLQYPTHNWPPSSFIRTLPVLVYNAGIPPLSVLHTQAVAQQVLNAPQDLSPAFSHHPFKSALKPPSDVPYQSIFMVGALHWQHTTQFPPTSNHVGGTAVLFQGCPTISESSTFAAPSRSPSQVSMNLRAAIAAVNLFLTPPPPTAVNDPPHYPANTIPHFFTNCPATIKIVTALSNSITSGDTNFDLVNVLKASLQKVSKSVWELVSKTNRPSSPSASSSIQRAWLDRASCIAKLASQASNININGLGHQATVADGGLAPAGIG